MPNEGAYEEILSSNLDIYDGTGEYNAKPIASESIPCHARAQSIVIEVPALTAMVFKRQ